jgi:two-component system, response regulator PdtaR
LNKNKLKILIVEDEVITAEDIRESLKLIGYENVSVSYTDIEALRMSVKNSYDLILMDVKLNGSKHDGIELAKIINNDIPIIYCTAYSDSETINRILHSPHLSYILKPFEVKKINEIIDSILYKKK